MINVFMTRFRLLRIPSVQKPGFSTTSPVDRRWYSPGSAGFFEFRFGGNVKTPPSGFLILMPWSFTDSTTP